MSELKRGQIRRKNINIPKDLLRAGESRHKFTAYKGQKNTV